MLFLGCLQRQIQTAVFGGKSSVKGAASGTASSVAFTPLQVGCLSCITQIIIIYFLLWEMNM